MWYSYLCIFFLDIVGREQPLFSSTAAFPPLSFILVNLDDITFCKAQVTSFTSVIVQRHTLWKSNGYPERLLNTPLCLRALAIFFVPCPQQAEDFIFYHYTELKITCSFLIFRYSFQLRTRLVFFAAIIWVMNIVTQHWKVRKSVV